MKPSLTDHLNAFSYVLDPIGPINPPPPISLAAGLLPKAKEISSSPTPTSDNRQVKECIGQASPLDELASALRRGDSQAAGAALTVVLSGDLPADQREKIIDLALEQRQWPIAITLLEPIPLKPIGLTLRWNLARNMAELQHYRPELYRRMEPVRSSGLFRICTSPAGRLTISQPVAAAPTGDRGGGGTGGRTGGRIGGGGVILSPGGDPQTGLEQIIPMLKPHLDKGFCVGLLSVGDGYALGRLAAYQPELFLDQQLAIHLIEPELELILNCLMLHDYTGEQGPIRQQRILWHIGPDAMQQYEAALQNDAYLPMIQVSATIGLHPKELAAGVKSVHDRIDHQTNTLRRKIQDHYAKLDGLKLASLITVQSDRPPRAMIMTSRFTSVLQYQAQDWNQSLQQLGWHGQVEMESSLHGRVGERSILAALEKQLPDVVLALDHLRREDLNVFPKALPFITWVQDLLPHLLEKSAGQSLGATDFVLTFACPLLVGDFDYPASQCLDVPMMMPPLPPLPPPPPLTPLTPTPPPTSQPTSQSTSQPTSQPAPHHPPVSPPSSAVQTTGGKPNNATFEPVDILYVSHMGWTLPQVLQQAIDRSPVEIEWAVRRVASAMVEQYQQGQSLAAMYDVSRFMDHILTVDAQGRRMNDDHRRKLLDALWNPLNITLYRQQALGWVIQVAQELNLTLEIYGKGWQTHPAYSRWAKGVLPAGRQWADRVCSARINLCLEPYIASTHNRLLLGLTCAADRNDEPTSDESVGGEMEGWEKRRGKSGEEGGEEGGEGGGEKGGGRGGGFFLVRDHPAHQQIPRLWRFVNREVSPSVQTAPQARRAVTPSKLAELESLLAQAANISYSRDGDAVAQLRSFERAGVVADDGTLLPKLDEIAFSDVASLKQKIEHYLNDPAARMSVVQTQRQAVSQRLSLPSVMRRVMPMIAKRLAQQSA